MNVEDFVRRRGLVDVPNPDYNPKAKKNKKPKYIQKLDVSGGEDNVFSSPLVEAIDNRYSTPNRVVDKYGDYGLTYNRISPNLELELVDAQSGLEQTKNALAQTVVSEIGLGTLRGFSDLADFVMSKVFDVEEDDYTNPVSEKLKQWQEEFKANNPIYYDQSKDITNGGLLSWGWWMSNIPSIASSLTLMIPSAGTARVLGYLGKATRLTKGIGNARKFLTNINKIDKATEAGQEVGMLGKAAQVINSKRGVDAANRMASFGFQGFVSRALENYQEANQVYSDLLPEMTSTIADMNDEEYQALLARSANELQGVDTTNKNEVAKRLAKVSADETFKDDMWNGLFDVYQLYALRNLKRVMNAPLRASVRRAHLNSLRYPGKSPEEIEKLMAGRSMLQKTRDKISDVLYGSKVAIGAEASEAVEEAVNYVAQEEGMHYGHFLLGTEKASDFDDRLAKYIRNGQLYDSAFWGLMGGVTFQAVGSRLARLSNAIQTKYNESKQKPDEKTGEKPATTPWNQAYADPEVTRRKGNIEGRQIAYNTLVNELATIRNQHENPWKKNTDGTSIKLDSEEERKIAEDRAYNKFATNLLMDSMFVGNWDLTKAYLESNEIRDALVEAGVLTQEEATTRQQNARNLANKIENLYDANIRAIENAMRGKDEITGANLEDIPIEFMQIVAANNMAYQLDADQSDADIASYTPLVDSEEERVKDVLASSGIDYKQSIRLFILSKQLGEIESDLEELQKTVKEGRDEKLSDPRTVSGQIAIRNLKNRKEVLLNMLRDTTAAVPVIEGEDAARAARRRTGANLLTSLRAVAATERIEGGGYRMNTASKRFKDLDAKITKALGATEETWDASLADLTAIDEHFKGYTLEEFKEVERQSQVINQNIAAALGKDGAIDTLNDVSKPLLNAYAQITHNEINKAVNLSNIAKTRSAILTQANLEMNQMNALRFAFVEQATNTLKRLAQKYDDEADNIDELLAYGTLVKDARDKLKEILSPEDFAIYSDCMKVIALNNERVTREKGKTSAMNSMLPELIKDAIYESKRDEYIDVEEEDEEIEETTEEDKTKEGESSTKSEKPAESKEKPKTDTTSSKTKKADTSGEKGKKLDFNYAKTGKKLSKPLANVIVNDDGVPTRLTIYDSSDDSAYTNVTLKPVGENEYELDYKYELDNNLREDTDETLTNRNLFVPKTPIIDGGKVIQNPTVVLNDDGSIVEIRTGIIDKVTSEEGEESDEDSEDAISSTGEEEHTDIEFHDDPEDEDGGGTPVVEYNISDDEYDKLLDEIQQYAVEYATDCVRNGIVYNEKELLGQIKEKYKDRKIEDELMAELWIKANTFASGLAKFGGANVEELKNIAEFLSASSISDEKLSVASAGSILKNAFTNVLNDYLKRSVVEEYNGKKVISLTNLLRYVREISDSPILSRALYDKFYQILSTDDDYILLEGKKLDKTSILSKSNLSSEDAYKREIETNGRNIGLEYIINKIAETESKNAIYEILNNTKPGDKLDYKIVNNGTGVEFYINEKKIGFATLPYDRFDRLEAVNRGWLYDIPKANDGSKSEIKEIFVRLLANPDNEEKVEVVRKLLQKRRYISRNIYSKESGKSERNPEYDTWIDDIWKAILDVDPDIKLKTVLVSERSLNKGHRYHIEQIVNHLFSVYTGTKVASDNYLSSRKLSREEYEKEITDIRLSSIDDWFDKLNEGYRSLSAIVEEQPEIVVDTIYEGSLIITPKSDAKPVNAEGVISEKSKDSLELVAASITEPGIMYSTHSPGNIIENPAISGGSTFVSITRNNGDLALIHAYPRNVAELAKENKAIKAIREDIINEFKRLITEWGDNPLSSTDEIEVFLNTLTSSKGKYKNNTALCKGITVSPIAANIPGLRIGFDIGGRTTYIHLFDVNKWGKTSTIDFGTAARIGKDKKQRTTFKDANNKEEAINKLVELLDGALEFNLGFGYVRGDSTTTGYAKFNTKKEFVVSIPNGKQHKFKSYRDFVINNGVINVTTESRNGSNFRRFEDSKDSFDKARITFRVANAPTSPVEESATESVTEPETLSEQVKAIIDNSNVMDVGDAIMSSILSNTQLGVLRDSKLLKAMPFYNVKFVDKLPNDAIASHSKNAVTIGGVKFDGDTIFVSQKWIDMLDTNKEQAARHLIHEAVHRSISKLNDTQRRNLFDSVREVYNSFVEANEKEGIREGWRSFEYNTTAADIRKYYKDGEINDKGLEEFLVESITRPILIDRLNSIAADGGKITNRKVGNVRSKNLFQKILAVVAKLFGLNINKGSLLEKEYKLFLSISENAKEQVVESTTESTEVGEETTPTEEIIDNREPQEEVVNTSNVEAKQSLDDITMEDIDEDDLDDSDDSRYTDEAINSLAQVRDSLYPENRQRFNYLVNTGGIQIQC